MSEETPTFKFKKPSRKPLRQRVETDESEETTESKEDSEDLL